MLIGKREKVIWLIVIFLMVLGLYALYAYKNMLSSGEGEDCGCNIKVIYKSKLLYIMLKTEIFGIYPVTLAQIGFPLGLLLSILAFFNIRIAQYIFAFSSFLISITIIPYLVLTEFLVGVFCDFCTVMQICVVLSSLLSLINLYKK